MFDIGYLKSLLPKIWKCLANNHRYRSYIDVEDIKTFNMRFRNEGIPFLTNELPTLGKALDRYHASSVWKTVPGFHQRQIFLRPFPVNGVAKEGGLVFIPVFLGRCLEACFAGDPVAVDCYRQMTLMFYKLEVEYDQDVVDEFITNFKTIDSELPQAFSPDDPTIARARSYIARVLCNSDPLDIRPCHGTGATACRTTNDEKWHKLRYYAKLDAVFSYPEYFFFSPTHLIDEMWKIEESVDSHPRARVCLVPKDARGPRIISCEPAELLYIQQGLMRKLYSELETNKLTRTFVNFEDQTINRTLAEYSSISGYFATIDLSDASDRVSFSLVRNLFPPRWVEALEACRSEETMLPSGEIVKLNKFAPMGSSCCFPVEAMVFWSIAVAAIQLEDERQWGTRSRSLPLPDVFVYGDDIIITTDSAEIVMGALESVGLKVNRDKSYTIGHFRESCGGDYYRGVDVTPVRVRKPIGLYSSSIVTDADLANCFIAKFGIEEAKSIIDLIDSAYDVPLPRSRIQLPCCINDEPSASNDVFYRRRWNKNLQRYEHRIPQPHTRALALREAAWSELLRKELTRGVLDNASGKYGNPLRKIEAALEPGYYAEVHSARMKWTYTWLG